AQILDRDQRLAVEGQALAPRERIVEGPQRRERLAIEGSRPLRLDDDEVRAARMDFEALAHVELARSAEGAGVEIDEDDCPVQRDADEIRADPEPTCVDGDLYGRLEARLLEHRAVAPADAPARLVDDRDVAVAAACRHVGAAGRDADGGGVSLE